MNTVRLSSTSVTRKALNSEHLDDVTLRLANFAPKKTGKFSPARHRFSFHRVKDGAAQVGINSFQG